MNINKVKVEDGKVGKGVKFERIRRITGYLVGTIDRFNDAKAAEVKDRVKHLEPKVINLNQQNKKDGEDMDV